MACSSQSLWSLASPANTYTTATWTRTNHTQPRRIIVVGRPRSANLASIGATVMINPSVVMNQ